MEVEAETAAKTEPRNNGGSGRVRGKGKRKIEIKKVGDQKKLAVCFSKRRKGLFRKASEISSICSAETAVVVFHSNGKVYSAGDVEAVFDRFVSGKRERFWWEVEPEEVVPERLSEFESAIVELKKRVDSEIEKMMNRVEKEPESNDGGGASGCCFSSNNWLTDYCDKFLRDDDGLEFSPLSNV